MAGVAPQQIDAATDALALHKMGLKLQAEAINNAKAAAEAARAILERQATAAEKSIGLLEAQAAVLDAGGTRRELVQMMFREMVAGYMKPSTATTPESQLADARNDAAFLKVAIEQALTVYDAVVPTQG